MRISTRGKIALSALLVVLTGWNLYANSRDPRDRNIADRTVLYVTAPVQKALTWCVSGVGHLSSGYVDLVGVKAENEQLSQQLESWGALEARNRELEMENERLRQLVDLRDVVGRQSVSAEVIGWGTSSRYRVVRIDRGRAHDVQPGQPVIGVHGAVGQVLHTSAGAADVLLLSDMSSNVAVRLENSRLRGIVCGDGRWKGSLEYIARQDVDAVEVGERLVTSGDDGVFPSGIAVGHVSAVEQEETGHFLSVAVEPAESLASLEEVIVLVEPVVSVQDEPMPEDPGMAP